MTNRLDYLERCLSEKELKDFPWTVPEMRWLIDRCRKLENALKYYADKEIHNTGYLIGADGGETAREALKELEEGE